MTYADIKQEFDDSLGFIQNDITALCNTNANRVNYTVALLVGCGCEALAESGAYQATKGRNALRAEEVAFAGLLPGGEWIEIAKPLFNAIRNGLAHGFDTKHILVNGQEVQIHFHWDRKEIIEIVEADGIDRLYIGSRPLGRRLCGKIDQFRVKLQKEPLACEKFIAALRKTRTVIGPTADIWERLKKLGACGS